mgnify:CR=1 FL=1
MSKLTHNKIVSKLGKLDEYLGYLTEIQKVNKESFISDYHLYGLAERYLQLSIEILLDTSKLLIAAEHLRQPNDNQDGFAVLVESKIISEELAGTLVGIAGFRNILVHEYENIDRALVYDRLIKRLDTFTNFQKEISQYLKR